jgi:hypothetical protein
MSYLDGGLALLAGVLDLQRAYGEVAVCVGFAVRWWALGRCNALFYALSQGRGRKKKRSDNSRGTHVEVCIAKKGMRLRDGRDRNARSRMLNEKKRRWLTMLVGQRMGWTGK